MATIYLALGSNVGDSRQHIAKAVRLLAAQISDISQAPLYVSRAVGYADQPDFVNTALCGRTALAPWELLAFTQGVEQKVGRIRRFRWGPREIDIDIIFYDNQLVDRPELAIPHPRFRERDFVLKPLCDLAPDFVDPVTGQTVQVLLGKLPADERSVQSRISG